MYYNRRRLQFRKRKRYYGPRKPSWFKHNRNALGKNYSVNTRGGQLVRVSNPGGIPPRFRTNLVYQYQSYLDITSSSANVYTQKLNSIYDLDYSNNIGNGQPAGRDRIADMYSLYEVKNCKIIIDFAVSGSEFQVSGTTTNVPATAVVVTYGSWVTEGIATTPTVPTYLARCENSRTMLVANNESKRMVCYNNMQRIAGLPGLSPFNSGLGANTGSDPGRLIWGAFKFSAPDAATGIETRIVFSIKMIFDVEYSQPKVSDNDTN